MGSTISSVVNQQNEQMKAQAQDQLNALLTMADLKFTNFMATVKDTSDSTLIPVDKILVMDHQVNAGVTNNADNIKNAISSAARAFASNDILTGLTAVIGAGLDAVFGNVAANQSEHTTYAITCGALGGIMRIDLDIFCYTFQSTALVSVTNNVVMVAYTISSVDASKLDRDTLRDVVQVCYGGLVTLDELNSIYQQMLAAYNGETLPVAPGGGGGGGGGGLGATQGGGGTSTGSGNPPPQDPPANTSAVPPFTPAPW